MNGLIASLLSCLTFVAAISQTADGGIISVSGQVVDDGQLVGQNLRKDAYVSDLLNVAHLFTEQSSFLTPASLLLDMTNTGLISTSGMATSATLGAGSFVNSYFMHYDISRDGIGIVSGSITFDADIFGLQFLDRTLRLSHPLIGQAGVQYQINSPLDGTLDSPQDRLGISLDRRTLTFTMAVMPYVDTLRIVTAVAPPIETTNVVPEPGSMVLLGIGLSGLAGIHRRRRTHIRNAFAAGRRETERTVAGSMSMS